MSNKTDKGAKDKLAKNRYVDVPVTGHNAEKLLEMAKVVLTTKFPFFGKLVFKMPLIKSNLFPTTAVDAKGRFYYNPKWVNSMTEVDAVFETAHEVMHLVQRCAARKPTNAIHSVWNVAADWVADLALIEAGVPRSEISKEAITDEELNKTRELETIPAVYAYLLNKMKNSTNCPACKEMLDKARGAKKDRDEKDKAEADANDPNAPGGDKEEGKEGEGEGGEDKEHDHAEHTCGIGVRQCCAGTTSDASEASPEENQAILENVLEAYHHAKNKGKVPGIVEDIVRELVKPSVRWQDLIKVKAREIFGRGRYQWKRQSRRTTGLRLPAREPEREGCVIAIDASGSVSEEEYIQALSECAEILNSSGCGLVTLIIHDCVVYYVGKVDVDALKKAPKSNGGTCHLPVFEVLSGDSEKWDAFKTEKPALFISFTDCYSDFPKEEPPYEVIWGMLGDNPGESYLPSWGKRVKVEVASE